MALTTAELYRIRYELGFNLLTTSAIPYIGVTQIFDQVIQPYLASGTSTTSSTTVTAASTATPVTLVLASATGFDSLARVVVDVDDREEVATVQSVSGSSITVLLKLAHTGTYPVIVEGAESIVRGILREIRGVHSKITTAANTAGLKRVDVIEFYGNSTAVTQTASLSKLLMHWRDQLAAALGVPNLWRTQGAAAQQLSLY